MTSNADNENEHRVFNAAVEFISKKLKSNKIRSSNVLDNLETISTIVKDAIQVIKEAQGPTDEAIDDTKANEAYAWMVMSACLSWYNQISKRLAEGRKST